MIENIYQENLIIRKKKNKTINSNFYEKTLFFESIDQYINYKLICKKDSIFQDIENKLYKKFPEYKNIKKYFLYEGHMIDINKTLEENKIKNYSHIIVVINDMSSNNNRTLSNLNNVSK